MDWYAIEERQSAGDLKKFGPTTRIVIRNDATGRNTDVRVQIATDLPVSLIRSGLAPSLGLDRLPVERAAYRVHMVFPTGILEFAALETPLDAPHDLVLGRDFLSTCRMEIDFNTGKWALQIGLT